MDQNINQRVRRSMFSLVKSEPCQDSPVESTKSTDDSANNVARSTNSQIIKKLELNYDFNYLLKLMNKRKLHLPCPLCQALVVNLTDHLTKTHFIKNINERRNFIDSVRNEFILSEEGVHKLLEFNKALKPFVLLNNKKEDNSNEQNNIDFDLLNSSNSNLEIEAKEIDASFVEENLNSNDTFEQNKSKKRKLSRPIKKPYTETSDSNIDHSIEISDSDESKKVLDKITIIESQLNQALNVLKEFRSSMNEKIDELNNKLTNTSSDLNEIKTSLLMNQMKN
ncbi:unnamed protein product [Brachionus calyciflorus]|uniref:Uncharacterized protein n=1 Tax=Brachionus calyciflorus TaxID=104777 RepID=A0A813W9C3_9BILA|nr:unnamed protein product [Brachionus calyciflorus]